MKIWLYCSYSDSPTGFRLGRIDGGGLVKDDPHRLLDRCFSYQGITRAYGRIPGTGSYVFVRPIKRQGGDSIFLNIGFETEDKSEYEKIYGFFEQYNTDVSAPDNRQREKEKRRSKEEDELFRRIRPIIIEDQSNSAFGLRVSQSHLASVVDEIRNCPPAKGLDDNFYLQSASETQAESFASNLWLSSILGKNYGLKPVQPAESGENRFKIAEQAPDAEKKKRLTRLLPVLLIIALAAIVIVILSRGSQATGIELAAQVRQTILPENSKANSVNWCSGIWISQMTNRGQRNITAEFAQRHDHHSRSLHTKGETCHEGNIIFLSQRLPILQERATGYGRTGKGESGL